MAGHDDEQAHYSIAVRIRRTVVQDAFVSVLVRDKVMRFDGDGAPTLDSDAIFARAIELGQHPDTEWKTEETTVDVHPIQAPASHDRTRLLEIDLLESEN